MKQRGIKTMCACAFGAVLVTTLVPAGIARADQADEDFTNFLNAHGINLGNTDQTVNMARVMCQDLNAGYTQKDEIDQLTGAHRLSQSQAEMFVGAATADYCPGKHSPDRPKTK